jgi:hypothetical protein
MGWGVKTGLGGRSGCFVGSAAVAAMVGVRFDLGGHGVHVGTRVADGGTELFVATGVGVSVGI